MADISTVRHDAIFDHVTANRFPVTIIGAGATGSRVFESLIELGITNITIYDDDVVEPHNLANQAFIYEDIGKEKVMACADIYKRKTGRDAPEEMRFINQRVTNTTPRDEIMGVVFLLTDTMASRIEIAEDIIKDNEKIFFVIETRMASAYGNVYSFNPHDYDRDLSTTNKNFYTQNHWVRWRDTLTDDESTETSACGASISVGPTASLTANLAVWQYILWHEDKLAQSSTLNFFLQPVQITTTEWKSRITLTHLREV